MEKGAVLILRFEFVVTNKFAVFAYFLDFWAKKSLLNYSLNFSYPKVFLYVQGENDELARFSDDYISMVPHSIFLQNSSVTVADSMPECEVFSMEDKFENITPYSLKSGQNEFGFKSDDDFVNLAFDKLKNGECINYNGYELSKFDDFKASYLLVTNLKALPKIFIAQEKSLIAMASFEKPIINFRTTSIFRANHSAAPLYFDVRFAWDLTIYNLCTKLFEAGINFIKVNTLNNDLKISILDDSFLVVNNTKFISKVDRDIIAAKKDKNLVLFGLIANEYNLFNKTLTNVFLSKNFDDYIKVYRSNEEFNLLTINLPSSFEELYLMIRALDGGDRLIDNFLAKFELPGGKIDGKNNFYSILKIIDQILSYDGSLLQNAMDFGGQKGVRIDFKLIGRSEFDIAKMVRSAMSFKLAGAEPKNISFGCLESLSLFISDIGDAIKTDFECENFILSGSLFECKTLANLTLKHTNSNFRSFFSEQYGLEIS